MLDLASAGDAVSKRLGIDVHDDLVAFAAAQGLGAVLEEALRQYGQCICTSRRPARRLIAPAG